MTDTQPDPTPSDTKSDTPPLDLDAIQARADAATEGPWYVESSGDHHIVPDVARWRGGMANALTFGGDFETAAFVAAARTDVPALVAEVRRLSAELAAAEALAALAAEMLGHLDQAGGYHLTDGHLYWRTNWIAGADVRRWRETLRVATTPTMTAKDHQQEATS